MAAAATYRGHSRVRLHRMDAQRMAFPDQSFDTVILFEAIYYLPDVDSFLSEARRVLRPGGALILSSVHCRWPGFNPSILSVKYYDSGELKSLLSRHGFESTLYAGFPEDTSGLLARAVRLVRQAAIVLHLIPRTMKGKEAFKRLFYGKLTLIPREITDGMAGLEPLVEIDRVKDTTPYRMIYAVARKSA
jgi:ubiquinone/menaquinone biosynthesis C-methylase UbiE